MAKATFTNVSALATVLAILDTFEGDFILVDEKQINKAELAEKLNTMITSFEKKSTSAKPTKTQIENVGYMETILDILKADGKPMTIKEISAQSETLAEFSTSKMSALLKKLTEENKVSKTYEKKQAYFTAC